MKKKLEMIAAALLAASACFAAEPAAEADVAVGMEKGVPGGVVISTLAVQAKVVEIDYETRELALLVPGGSVAVFEAGPEVVNFPQIQKGDMVKAMVTEQLVVALGASEAELDDGEEVDVVLAPVGDKPGGIVADTVRMTAAVVEIDGELRTAILRFEDGSERTVGVRDDIDLTQRRIGEKVVFEVTKMIAVSVEKQ